MAGGLHPRLTEKLAEQEGERKDGSRKEGSSVRSPAWASLSLKPDEGREGGCPQSEEGGVHGDDNQRGRNRLLASLRGQCQKPS